MALYGPAIKKLVPHGSEDPRITPRAIILHVAVSESDSLFHYFNGPSGGVESHFYIRRSGAVEQYRDTNTQADANEGANGFAISIETQGMGYGKWGDDQMKAIKNLIEWLAGAHRNIPLVVIDSAYGSGVGYHVQFPGVWDTRGATCPGPDRQNQFWNELSPWLGGAKRGGGAQSVPYTAPTSNSYYDPPVNRSVESIQRIVDVTADGFYGRGTRAAVKKYQKGLGVKADGYWGADTEKAYRDRKGAAKSRYYDPPVNRSVKSIQNIVKVNPDGYYGNNTKRAVAKYQKTLGVKADGLWGPSTEAAHKSKSNKGIKVDGLMGPATVTAIQEWVGATQDGIMGNRTEKALQRKLGVKADGIIGRGTVRALQKKVGANVDGIWGRETTRKLQQFLNKTL